MSYRVGCLFLWGFFSGSSTTAVESDDPFAVDAESSTYVTPDHLVPLRPYPKDWETAYNKQLAKHLGLDEVYLARMLVRASFGGEYLMRIRGDKDSYAFDHSKKFFVTCVISDNSIWYSMPDNNDEKVQKPVNTKFFEAPIPVETARRLCRIWNQMIFRTRYSKAGEGGLDGVTIEFASRYGHGEAWSPTDGTSPRLLMDVGEALVAYAKAPEAERKKLLTGVKKKADVIELHLEKRAEQDAAPQIRPR